MIGKGLMKRVLLIGAIVLVMSYISINAAEGTANHLTMGIVNSIINIPDTPTLELEISKYTRAAPYQRLAVAWQLLTYLDNKKVILGLNYEPTKDKHNLQLVAGRAAWAIELLLGVDLPVVETIPSDADSAELKRLAKECVKAFENALLSLAKTYDIGSPTAEMVKQYKGKIQPGDRAYADQNTAAMLELFTLWFPLGNKLTDLESIVGENAKKQDGLFAYIFDNGYSATAFVFEVSDDGLIRNVSIR